MLTRSLAVACAAALCAVSISVEAATPAVRARMLADSMKLAPPSLRGLLERERAAVERGMEEAAARYRPLRAGRDGSGNLPALLDEAAKNTRELFRNGADFPAIAAAFGKLLYFCSEMNLPFNCMGPAGQAVPWEDDFRGYIAHHMGGFRVIFDGYDKPDVGADRAAYVRRRSVASQGYLDLLQKAYQPEGPGGKVVKGVTTFDVRSTPYAIAQLCFTHGTSDTVKVWVSVWQDVGGDMGGTPFYKPAPAGGK